jgi:hypothetical protein
MRAKLASHLADHGTGALDDLPRQALRSLAENPAAFRRREPHGGD